jgi:phosphoglycerol transferase MdoB-like AlkP superfamily enzyme
MSEKQITPINSGILTILFIVFLVLKLTGNIDWSWWWVTSPLWLPVAILFFVLSVLFIAGIIMFIVRGNKQED